jgi:hypothetical protein
LYVHRDARLVYLAHPRTASSATAKALKGVGFEMVSGDHHMALDTATGLWAASVATTIRCHFDKLVSLWYHLDCDPPLGPEFWAAFLGTANRERYPDPHRLYALHAAAATTLLRFERLQFDLNDWLTAHGVEPVVLPHTNRTKARKGRHWRSYYDAATLLWVARQFGREMCDLGYLEAAA